MTPLDFLDEAAAHTWLIINGYEVQLTDDDGKTFYKATPKAGAVDHIGVVMTVTGVDENDEANAWKPRADGRWLVNLLADLLIEEPPMRTNRSSREQEPLSGEMRPVDPDIAAFHNVSGKEIPLVRQGDAAKVVEITTAPVRVFM